jgi:hypothetical protein
MAEIKVLFPAPGGPVIPIIGTLEGFIDSKNFAANTSLFSIPEIVLANFKKIPFDISKFISSMVNNITF